MQRTIAQKSVLLLLYTLFVRRQYERQSIWKIDHLKALLFHSMNNVLLLKWNQQHATEIADDGTVVMQMLAEFKLELAKRLLGIYQSFLSHLDKQTKRDKQVSRAMSPRHRTQHPFDDRHLLFIQLWYLRMSEKQKRRVRALAIRNILFVNHEAKEHDADQATIVEESSTSSLLVALILLYNGDNRAVILKEMMDRLEQTHTTPKGQVLQEQRLQEFQHRLLIQVLLYRFTTSSLEELAT